ncbi:MAG: hypothetical protein NVSMB26_08020 [Beijerinckiaceae bacterium]
MLAREIRDDRAQIADRSIGVDQAGLLAAAFAIADKLHRCVSSFMVFELSRLIRREAMMRRLAQRGKSPGGR